MALPMFLSISSSSNNCYLCSGCLACIGTPPPFIDFEFAIVSLAFDL